MDSFYSSTKIRTAADGRKYRKNLSCDAYTTQDFFIMKPVLCRELVPNANMVLNIGQFTRTTPLTRPMYGNVRVINRAFAVPLRTLVDDWYAFITQSPTSSGAIPTRVPSLGNNNLCAVFAQSQFATKLDVTTITPAVDFVYNGFNYQFTDFGRMAYDILLGLGYQINFSTTDSTEMSALPLLAYAKVFSDWYINPQFTAPTFNKASMGSKLTATQITTILTSCIYTNYEKDYFTSAWVNPNAPNTYLNNPINIGSSSNVDIYNTIKPSTITTPGSAPNVNVPTISASNGITENALTWLKRITDYVKRQQIVGSRPLDRFLARFGIKPSSVALDRSNYIGHSTTTIEISDVTATTDMQIDDKEQALGSLGGKALGYGKGTITYDTGEDYTYIIVISTVVPHIGYFEGRNRHLQHLSLLDFYSPEFDGISVAPIRVDELKADFTSTSPTATAPSSYNSANVFGWSSRYAEYKTNPYDVCSGAFRVRSRSVGLDSWHLMRFINPATDLTLNPAFTRGNPLQYNRIFNATEQLGDYFVTVFHFDMHVTDPIKPLFDDYDFDGGDLRDVDINGTQLN